METKLQTLADIEEERKLSDEVQKLDDRLSRLKARWAPKQKYRKLRKFGGWIKSNWTLLAFLFSVGSVVYVYGKYGISYFESFKTIADTKESAKRYNQTGDELLLSAEFKAADEAYQIAVAIDPSYVAAREGLMTTQILISIDSFSTYSPVAVEAKLRSLENVSQKEKNVSPKGYLIPYIRGIIKIDQDRRNEARKLFEESLTKNREFVGNYIQLGYLALFDAEIDEARRNFKIVLDKLREHPLISYNLGLCDMLSLDFKSAIQNMERAKASSSDRLEILLSLGEAYRYAGDIDTAIFYHEAARTLLEDPKLKEGANYGRGTFNYLPESSEDFLPASKDKDRRRSFEQAVTLNQYKALINYALSIDYALQGKFSDADKSFSQGYKADQTINGEKAFGCFYLNRSDFVIRRQNPSPVVSQWFSKRRSVLDRNRTCEL